MINNARIQIRDALEDFEEADWNPIIKINLSSAFIVSNKLLKESKIYVLGYSIPLKWKKTIAESKVFYLTNYK